MKVLLSVLALVCCAFVSPAIAQDGVISGKVIDASTSDAIGGASIRVEGSSVGTYSRAGGRFRLPVKSLPVVLQIRSVGYEDRILRLSAADTALVVSLKQRSVMLSGVSVVGDITPEEVIRRAVARKEENAARISTLISSVYSKFKMNIDMAGLDGKEGPDNSISETFSTIYDRRKPDPKKHVRIVQRRQTANVPAGSNLMVFDEFFDFTQDELVLIKTRLITPLGRDALSSYRYTIRSKKPLGDLMVYELDFEPSSRLFPGFQGTLSIIEGTYQVIAAEFRPTDETAFPFLKGLTFEQRYDRVNDSIWAPSFQNITAKARVNVVAGIMELSADVSAQAYVTDIQVNVPIDDSLLTPPKKAVSTVETSGGGANVKITNERQFITVDSLADSTLSEYWDKHAYAEPSGEEREIYRKQDSVKQAGGRKSSGAGDDDGDGGGSGTRTSSLISLIKGNGWSLGLDPLLDRSSITSLVYGGTLTFRYGPVQLAADAGFGSNNTKVGKVDLGVVVLDNSDFRVRVFGTVMSSLATVQESRSILRRLDFLNLSNLLYTDYSDFFRKDGFELGFSVRTSDVRAAISGEWTRHINMPIIESVDRTVVRADAGDYQMLNFTASILEPSIGAFFLGETSPVSARINAMVGRETASDVGFWSVDAAVDGRIPTFSTGYTPMQLDVTVHAGIQSTAGPVQTRFVVPRRFPILGSRTDMTTVTINTFAGTEFLRVVSEHNFSDIWWRLIGLPTFAFGRGIDLIGRFAAVNVTQRAQPVVPGVVFDSTPGVYMEAGFAVARIPTFVSDLFWLRFDAMWPVGPLSPRGSFGWALSLSSPLL